MTLDCRFEWRGRSVAWRRSGSGPAVVFCHGTPWSSLLWGPLRRRPQRGVLPVYLWDMPGYGRSSKLDEQLSDLGTQGELFRDLLAHWELDAPMSSPTTSVGRCSLRGPPAPGRVVRLLGAGGRGGIAPVGFGLLPTRRRASRRCSRLSHRWSTRVPWRPTSPAPAIGVSPPTR